MVKRFLNVASIFLNFNSSSPSSIATCTALHAIRKILQAILQPVPGKYTLLFYFLNFSSVFREILRGRGLFPVKGTCKHLLGHYGGDDCSA
jgi:hypothetical protein